MTDKKPLPPRCRHGQVDSHSAVVRTRSSGQSHYSCPGGQWYADQGRTPPKATWPDGSEKN